MSAPIVAVIGGGQLARMMQESATALGIHLRVLVESDQAATAQVVPDAPVGAATDEVAITRLVQGANVLTFEHEHVPGDFLRQLARKLPVEPHPDALVYAQNKLKMRQKMAQIGVPNPRWAQVEGAADLEKFAEQVGWSLVLKTPTGGYDGKGVLLAHSFAECQPWLQRISEDGGVLLAEEAVPFTSEIAVLLARRPSGEIAVWPVAQTIQENGVCAVVHAPAPNLDTELAAKAQEIGKKIAKELRVTGVMAVEMFVTDTGVVVNELAMRPHNSGHWTIEGSVTSQFEQHLRAVLDLPLGDTRAVSPACTMVNLLGSEYEEPRVQYAKALAVPAAKIHYYGKSVRPGRKLGHVTVVGEDFAKTEANARKVVNILKGNAK
ncbi:MAG: 5-(carboxyamino)imidazole ribonucleotide synthase [Actinomycetaceae bacterium]|nr:5-(carboxyamino)imidazole ribonucleotide synthase [Actinomycetaceae bacterium]